MLFHFNNLYTTNDQPIMLYVYGCIDIHSIYIYKYIFIGLKRNILLGKEG